METKQCPNCGLHNAASAMWCDCGLRFVDQLGPPQVRKPTLPTPSTPLVPAGPDKANLTRAKLYRAILSDVDRGVLPAAVVKTIQGHGLSHEDAWKLVNQALASRLATPYTSSGDSLKGFNRMLGGLGLFVLAVIITGITYLSSAPGETYYVCWGAMLLGGLNFLAGLIGWLGNR